MDKAKDVASKVNSSSKQVKHKSAKNKGASSLKNVSLQNANNASGRIGVAAVALASTLSMLLPGATALAKTPLNADSFDSSYVKSAAKTSGKGAGKGNGNGLYKNGLFNTGATSELAKRQMVSSVKELVKHADSNVDSNASAEGVDNQEAAAGDSSVGVKDSGERSVAGSEAASETGNGDIDGTVDESNNNSNDVRAESSNKRIKTTTEVQSATKSAQNNQKVAKPDSKAAKKEQSAEAKPVETTASKTESTKSEPKNAAPAKTEVVNPATASKLELANSEPAAKTGSETKTNSSAKTESDQKSAQPASTENEQPENAQNAQSAAEQPESAQKASAEGTNPASTESAQPAAKAKNDSTTPRVRKRRDTNQNAEDSNKGSSLTPADAGASSIDRSNENANGSNNNSNANSQVIKPNEQNPTAKTTEQANEQVQTDKKPKATYNLQIRYTIGGAANKQLVQPYELTIDEGKLNNLDKDGSYEYIELPKSAGYRPSVYHSGDYQYYIKDSEGKYVIDDGTNADAVRYLRLNKKLITDYAVKKRQAVGGNNVAQSTQNPSSTQAPAEDGIQYYGELNINYAPKTAKYYVRHMLQKLDNKDEFEEAPNLGIGKVITVTHKDGTTEKIHVTEITGTVGSDVSAVSTYIPGYEPEHNLISSPLSDSEDEKDKLVLNLRYYRKAYEVDYDSDGGTDVTAQKVYYQQKVPSVTEPTKRGYTFKGWSLVDPNTVNNPSSGLYSDPTVISDKDFKMPDHDVKFRAIWEANKTTSYRVNVWVQKADLVDKEHPDSRANYDFVGLVERKNVKTGSSVDLDNMSNAGVANDSTRLSGADENNPISDSELGLTKEELQGKNPDHKDGLISKFNWMNDTPVTSLDGYDTENPDNPQNYTVNAKGERVYKDDFTRYFKVNKKLTRKSTKDPNNTSTTLSANDLDNNFDLVYDRKEYELIFAKPAGLKFDGSDSANNAAIKRKDEKGKTTIYCYAGGGECSKKYDNNNEDDNVNAINHKGYRVKVRYGQSLTDIWPDVNELDFAKEGVGSLGWVIGYTGGDSRYYRDTPPYRFTKKEFADPSWRAVFEKNQKDRVEPRISDNPDTEPNNTHELRDNQRLLTADSSKHSQPIQVIIRKQSIASAKKSGEISDDDYELSTDSYSKDDASNGDYKYTAPSIAGFNPADGYDKKNVDDSVDAYDFENNREEWYNESHGHGNWDDLSDDEQKAFAKKYHLAFRKYRGVPVDEQEDYSG
ncbi:InlB B-repeat-containing protein, partial [Bifidobacterium sp. UMB6791A]|nr:InlB B-repeat-containing protein [Bifidobacterium sp. UMB6791A]